MDIETLIEDFKILPEQAQREVSDFVAILKARYQKSFRSSESKKAKLLDEPFLGLWKDRSDLKDSTAWIRKIREKEWGPNG